MSDEIMTADGVKVVLGMTVYHKGDGRPIKVNRISNAVSWGTIYSSKEAADSAHRNDNGVRRDRS